MTLTISSNVSALDEYEYDPDSSSLRVAAVDPAIPGRLSATTRQFASLVASCVLSNIGSNALLFKFPCMKKNIEASSFVLPYSR